jgi:N-acetylneuraminic acid mutarotase
LLSNGKVLVAGGWDGNDYQATAELYDPDTGSWTITVSLSTARADHTATLLPNGQVLVAGGVNGAPLDQVELYDPTTGTWTVTDSLSTARFDHTATLLPNGQVLVAGGADGEFSDQVELYDPASGTWSDADDLGTGHLYHTATLLLNGKVLVAGGDPGGLDTELYDVGLDFGRASRPVIRSGKITSTSHAVRLTGSRFEGISEADGGGVQDSATSYPVVQLRSIDNSQLTYLLVDPVRGWSDTGFSSLPARGFIPGPALVTVFTNGVPSKAKYFVIPQ